LGAGCHRVGRCACGALLLPLAVTRLGLGRPGAAALAGGRRVQRITGEALHLWPTGTVVGDAPVGRRPGCRRVPRWAPKECSAVLRAGCRRVGQ